MCHIQFCTLPSLCVSTVILCMCWKYSRFNVHHSHSADCRWQIITRPFGCINVHQNHWKTGYWIVSELTFFFLFSIMSFSKNHICGKMLTFLCGWLWAPNREMLPNVSHVLIIIVDLGAAIKTNNVRWIVWRYFVDCSCCDVSVVRKHAICAVNGIKVDGEREKHEKKNPIDNECLQSKQCFRQDNKMGK